MHLGLRYQLSGRCLSGRLHTAWHGYKLDCKFGPHLVTDICEFRHRQNQQPPSQAGAVPHRQRGPQDSSSSCHEPTGQAAIPTRWKRLHVSTVFCHASWPVAWHKHTSARHGHGISSAIAHVVRHCASDYSCVKVMCSVCCWLMGTFMQTTLTGSFK